MFHGLNLAPHPPAPALPDPLSYFSERTPANCHSESSEQFSTVAREAVAEQVVCVIHTGYKALVRKGTWS